MSFLLGQDLCEESLSVDEMAWAEPKYSRRQVDEAGALLATAFQGSSRIVEAEEETDEYFAQYYSALEIINNWRSSHSFPLNTFQNTLRRKSKEVDPNSITVQRIKRLSSIRAKLIRFPGIRLSQIQDIGGCRAVVANVSQVRKLHKLYRQSDLKHRLHHEDDYISKPKPSGYRGIHLIYSYYSDRKSTYNNLRIEIQLRSIQQHAWATAVETVGTFIRQALKSSQGEEQWLRFFSLMGTAMSLVEKTTAVPDTPTSRTMLKSELKRISKELNVEDHLISFGATLQMIEQNAAEDDHYFLLELHPADGSLNIKSYGIGDLLQATEDYLTLEKSLDSSSDAVLVSADSISALKRAYPNYFLDTHLFITLVRQAIK